MITGSSHSRGFSPYQEFSMKKNLTNNFVVLWKSSINPKVVCKKYIDEGYSVLISRDESACSVVRNYFLIDTCTIVTNQKISMGSFGYQSKYCFQGKSN
jgi:hypothetical protein